MRRGTVQVKKSAADDLRVCSEKSPNIIAFEKDAANSAAALNLDVIAPRKARCFLRGESPRRVRASHPPVLSLASVEESPGGGEQNRRSVDRASWRP